MKRTRKKSTYHPKARNERHRHILEKVSLQGKVTNQEVCEDFAKECVGNCVSSAQAVKPWVTRTLKDFVTKGVLTQTGGRGKATTYEAGPNFQVPG